MRWTKRKHGEWKKWFAWHWVTIHTGDNHQVIWLETVERCITSHYPEGDRWNYRETIDG